MPTSPALTNVRFSVRNVQAARAFLAAVAALMITFTPDHGPVVGLAVFGGFAVATAIVFGISAWLTYPAGRRWGAVLLAVITLLPGMIAGLGGIRTETLFFVLVIVWAILSGITEFFWGLRDRRTASVPRSESRDAMTVGVMSVVFGLAMLLVRPEFALDYFIAEAGVSGTEFTLTGITIGVGLFGAYAAIVAVYLAIAALSPRPAAPVDGADVDASTNPRGVSEEMA